MIDLVFLTVATIAFCTAIIKIRAFARRPESDPALRAMCGFLTALGLAFLFLSNTAQSITNGLFPNLGRLLGNAGTMIAAYATLALLVHLTYSPAARSRLRVRFITLAVTLTAMATLFFATPRPESHGVFGSAYATEPTLASYALLYAIYLSIALIDLLVLCWRYARRLPERFWLRLGLRLDAFGCFLGLVYAVEKAIYVGNEWAGLDLLFPHHAGPCTSPFTPAPCGFSIGLPATAVLVIIIGVTIPAWGPRIGAPFAWIRRRGDLRKLEPLWRALQEASPHLAFTTVDDRHADTAFKLYRRVIEIRDGQLALRPYRDPALTTAATQAARNAGLTGAELHATIEAAEIAAALTAARSAEHPEPLDDPPPVSGAPAGTTLTAETAWLVRVAEAFTRSPIVRAQAARSRVEP